VRAEQIRSFTGKSARRIDYSSEAVCLFGLRDAGAQADVAHAYELVAGGAADEITVRWNSGGARPNSVAPAGVAGRVEVNTSTTLFGQDLSFPVLLAPTSFHRIYHPEGELATARGASAGGAILRGQQRHHHAHRGHRQSVHPAALVSDVRSVRPEFSRDVIKQAERAGCRPCA